MLDYCFMTYKLWLILFVPIAQLDKAVKKKDYIKAGTIQKQIQEIENRPKPASDYNPPSTNAAR